MSRIRYLSYLTLPALVLGFSACSPSTQDASQDPNTEPNMGEEELERSYVEAGMNFHTVTGEGDEAASYRMASASIPTSGDFQLMFASLDNPGEILHTEWVENAPFGSAALRIPADIQGQFFLSAWIYGEDGSVFATADLIQDASGAPMYPDAPKVTIDLRFGQVTDLTFVFYEQLDFGGGTVDLNADLSLDLIMTPEQQDMLEALDEPSAMARLSGCLAYNKTATQSVRQSTDGNWHWEDHSGAVLIVGETCTLEVEISEDGAPRLQGAVDFTAPPGDGRVVDLSMVFNVIDAYVDVSFSIMGTFADIGFEIDEQLVTWLDEGLWEEELQYVLIADNGYTDPVVSHLLREGSHMSGVLSPLDQYSPTYDVTLLIMEGDSILLSGWSTVDMYAGAQVNIGMAYELDLIVAAETLTNIQFNAWIEDDPSKTEGIEVNLEVVTPEGFVLRDQCFTGEQAAYSCTIQVPTHSLGEFKVHMDGYQTVYGEIDASTIETISLPYIALQPGSDDEGSDDGDSDDDSSDDDSSDDDDDSSTDESSTGVQPSDD